MLANLIGAALLLASPAAPDTTAPAIHYLYLVRHGFYDRGDRVDDRIGNGLNALGREQAARVAARLARLPVRLDRVVTSDYTRARETAARIARALGRAAVQDTLLRECTPTSNRPDLAARADPVETAACDSSLRVAWERYARPAGDHDERDVLVCHGNVIRWFVTRALGADVSRWATMDIANASLTVIAVRPDGTTRLVSFSDVGHLPVDEQTWAGRGAGWGKPVKR